MFAKLVVATACDGPAEPPPAVNGGIWMKEVVWFIVQELGRVANREDELRPASYKAGIPLNATAGGSLDVVAGVVEGDIVDGRG